MIMGMPTQLVLIVVMVFLVMDMCGEFAVTVAGAR